jgi:hypothetical protein
LSAEAKLKALTTTMQPPPNATRWSTRSMAKAVGISHSSVQRIWRETDLKPHLVRTFKVSNDPKFAERVTDVVGLYMNPPDKALVLCVDEKSQIQPLDRTQPGLPLKKGRAATMTHDSIAGAIGGAGGGQILQALIPALAGAAGGELDVGSIVGQLVGGGVGGAILTVIAGLIKSAMSSKQIT